MSRDRPCRRESSSWKTWDERGGDHHFVWSAVRAGKSTEPADDYDNGDDHVVDNHADHRGKSDDRDRQHNGPSHQHDARIVGHDRAINHDHDFEEHNDQDDQSDDNEARNDQEDNDEVHNDQDENTHNHKVEDHLQQRWWRGLKGGPTTWNQ
jgi:hypothetical protein